MSGKTSDSPEHTQVLVEHKKGFADGVHDCLSERSGFFVLDERLVVHHHTCWSFADHWPRSVTATASPARTIGSAERAIATEAQAIAPGAGRWKLAGTWHLSIEVTTQV
jgi:hypothetical protein